MKQLTLWLNLLTINSNKEMKTKSILLILLSLILANTISAQIKKISVLVYTTPDVYHNQSVPTAVTQLKELATKNFVDLTWSQLESNFCDSILENYSVVVFLHSNDSKLNFNQLESLKRFIRKGRGFVGIHAAAVNKGQNDWFKKLIGRNFIRHPEKQTGVMTNVDQNFPATMHLPEKWVWTDEWYEYGDALTNDQHILLTVDESSYVVNVGMGKIHPIAWYQEYDGGRSFYTGLGHMEYAYTDELFLNHLFGGIYWAATGKGISKY